jgi:hypothetical protein
MPISGSPHVFRRFPLFLALLEILLAQRTPSVTEVVTKVALPPLEFLFTVNHEKRIALLAILTMDTEGLGNAG